MGIAQEGLLQGLTALEAMALQDVLDPAVEPLDHAARHCRRTNGGRCLTLRAHRGREMVVDARSAQCRSTACCRVVDLPGTCGEHHLRNQEVFGGKRDRTGAGVSV